MTEGGEACRQYETKHSGMAWCGGRASLDYKRDKRMVEVLQKSSTPRLRRQTDNTAAGIEVFVCVGASKINGVNQVAKQRVSHAVTGSMNTSQIENSGKVMYSEHA